MTDHVKILDLTDKLQNSRFVIVGDIHGCHDELISLLDSVNFNYESDYLISVGDLIDRGPKSKEVYELFKKQPKWFAVSGNHDEKFVRYLRGNKVSITHGLDKTLEQFKDYLSNDVSKGELLDFYSSLPFIIKTPAGYVVHGGFNPTRPPNEQFKQDCIFMRYFGGRDYFDDFRGFRWYTQLPNNYPNTFTGHNVMEFENHHNRNIAALIKGEDHKIRTDWLLDGGCVFGLELRLWDSTDGQVHVVKALKDYSREMGSTLPR